MGEAGAGVTPAGLVALEAVVLVQHIMLVQAQPAQMALEAVVEVVQISLSAAAVMVGME